MFCCDVDGAVGESIGAPACPRNRIGPLRTHVSKGKREVQRKHLPFFESLAMGIIVDAADHEVGQVAIFMCYHVDETVLKYCQLILIMV